MRVILYTGKGGVGKTTVAAATALRCADRGYRTIILSTDPAHSLSDSFDLPLGPDPTLISPNLWGQEIDVLKEIDRYWETVREWLSALMRWQGVNEVMAEELAVLPGMEELVGLLYIARYAEGRAYDLVIVDCAPTAETLRLLSFPEVARWYMNRIFPIERRVVSTLGPVARTFISIPLPDARVHEAIQNLYTQLERVRSVLSDPEVSSVRLVVNAEKMVIREAQRTFTYLNLYNYPVDMVVCNRLLPQQAGDGYFASWKESQERYLQTIREAFAPVPVLTAPMLPSEVVGVRSLRELAGLLYGERDPASLFYQGLSQEVRQDEQGYILRVRLPFIQRENLSLLQSGEELVVQAGPFRRSILLPRALAGLPVQEAVWEGEALVVRFARRAGRPSPRRRRGRRPPARDQA